MELSNRYAKQIKVSYIGASGQSKLQNLDIAVIGQGALGSVLAEQLVRAGVGTLRIIDRDFVELSNLHRQFIYTEQDAEQFLPKALAAEAYYNKINSNVTIQAHVADLSSSNIDELLHNVHLIVDGTDNFAVRYLINDYAVAHHIPWIYGAIVGTSGSTATFIPGQTPCYACLFPVEPEFGAVDTCDTAGVISPIVQMVASIQATEVMKIATNQFDALHQSLFQLDCWTNEQLKLDISSAKNSNCPVCNQHQYLYLHRQDRPLASSMLCGRNSVQVTAFELASISLDQLQSYYSGHYEMRRNTYLLKLIYNENITIVFFPNGRAIVQGTEQIQLAEAIIAKIVQF